MAPKAARTSSLSKNLRGLERKGERDVVGRNRKRQTNRKQSRDVTDEISIQYLPVCGENRGFADGLEEALQLISSTCFQRKLQGRPNPRVANQNKQKTLCTTHHSCISAAVFLYQSPTEENRETSMRKVSSFMVECVT